MTAGWLAVHVATLALWPVLVIGIINRVKARWGGRRGPPLAQLGYDLVRLFRKDAVRSTTTTWVFRLTPWIGLAAAVGASLVVPLAGPAPLGFRFDFILFVYGWGLGRVALMLGALDTGSAFEGMGASREATFGALLEPALVLVAIALTASAPGGTLADGLAVRPEAPATIAVWVASIIALVIVIQVEAARMPVDDPTTHLELTMIHEVMILDHSGPDLGAVQLAAAIKLTTGIGLLANLGNPMPTSAGAGAVALGTLATSAALAAGFGAIEAISARLRLRAIPQYILIALAGGTAALLATTWQGRL